MSSNTYDFIVVGSGSGGGAVAARLSENGKYQVLCLEAGKRGHRYIWTRSPVGIAFMVDDPNVNWCDNSEPNDSHGDRPLRVAHGKILGGSSAINGTVYNRGQHQDYDDWAQMGCRGWSYEDVLPFFKKLESTTVGSDDYRGRTGPVTVTESSKLSPFYDLFIEAAQTFGLPYNADYCGASQTGVAMAQQNVFGGRRQSTATQYLHPASKRANMTILSGAEASSLIIEGNRCVGVRYRRNGVNEEVRATREVIVSCGAINSPKLLELSGIGNPVTLAKFGIPLVKALPGVGENLRDHFGATLRWTFRKRGLSLAAQGRGWRFARELLRYVFTGKGFMSQGFGSIRVFTKSHPGVAESDIQMVVCPYIVEYKDGKQVMSPDDGFLIYAQPQRPESTGNVHLKSADPSTPPAINYRFMDTENDRRISVEAVRQARKIVMSSPLKELIAEEQLPGPAVQTDEQIVDLIRKTGRTTFHFAGTCKMGTDAMAVVDERLRVHGIGGLRVADASIMPTLVSGNTNIPCIMIGEKCAAMVLADAETFTTSIANQEDFRATA